MCLDIIHRTSIIYYKQNTVDRTSIESRLENNVNTYVLSYLVLEYTDR